MKTQFSALSLGAMLSLLGCADYEQIEGGVAEAESALTSPVPVFLHYSLDGHFNDDSGNNNHGVLIDEGDTAFVSSPAAFGQAWNDPQPKPH
jgi:hypothetical protein